MVWGTAASTSTPATTATELISKASTTHSIVVLPFRKFGDPELIALCEKLAAAPSITEIQASGKKLGADGANALGALLGSGKCALRKLAAGDSAFAECGGLGGLLHGLTTAANPCPLQTLDLGLKGFDGARDGATLQALLSCCDSLRELDLSRNPKLGAGVSSVAASGCLLHGLTRLDLSETGLDGAALFDLGHHAAGRTLPLATLYLSRNPSLGGDAKDLSTLLVSFRELTCLRLQGCALDATDAEALSIGLRPSGAVINLTELKLCDNPSLFAPPATLPSRFIDSALPTRAEYEASLSLSRDQRLAIERRTRGGGSAAAEEEELSSTSEALLSGLAACPKLTLLTIGDCGLTDAGALTLCRGLATTASSSGQSSLTELDARSNRLSAKGAAALLLIGGLRKLTLFNNPRIADEAAARLPTALDAAAALHTLDLGACALSAEALRALTSGLRGGAAPQLRCLELFGNGDEKSRDEWLAALAELKEAREEVDVAWKEPAGDAPPGAN